MVKTYSLKKDGGTYLSKNFKVSEYASHDGADLILIDTNLVTIDQKVRDHFNAPVTISSGYRSAAHNAKSGGAQSSYHMKGMASDLIVTGVTPLAVAQYLESLGVKGIGLYVYSGGNFVHCDTRTSKYYWKQTSKTSSYFSVSTFTPTTSYKVTAQSGLKVRSSMSTASTANVLGVLPYNSLVPVISISNGWAKFNYNGTVGYSSASYLTKA